MENISALDLKKRIDGKKDFLLLDVREAYEHETAKIDYENSKLIPMSKFPEKWQELLGFKNKKIVAYCHSGARSLSAANFLKIKGFENVKSLKGGINEYSKIDSSVPFYKKNALMKTAWVED